MQIRTLLSSKMDGLRRWAERCQREMGCSEICLTPTHLFSPHVSPLFFSLSLPPASVSLIQIPPNKICPTIVLDLLTLSCWCVTSFSFCFPPLCLVLFSQFSIWPFLLLPPPGPHAGHTYFYSPQNGFFIQNIKGFLICGLHFYLIMGWGVVYSAGAAERFSKVSISSLPACCNLRHHANSQSNSMNLKLTWLATIFPINSVCSRLHCLNN